MTDIVITYVDGLDPLWQKDYETHVGRKVLAKRFRDWGTLKYLMRGIERFMPYVRNVYLVVSRDSQVPEWVDRENVHVVLHGDIIPSQYLPTFNSTTIEMFLHRIPGICENYIYFNDDCFPIASVPETTFFREGKAVAYLKTCIPVSKNLYRLQTMRSSDLARRAAGLKPSRFYIRPQHASSAMKASACEQVWDALGQDLSHSLTPLRAPQNPNQYLFTDYMYLKKMTVRGRIPNKHFSLATTPVRRIASFLENPACPLMCVNDVKMSQWRFGRKKRALLDAFDMLFPEKSKFEH